MARPTKKEAVLKLQRNTMIKSMANKGYPLVYIAAIYNISKGAVSKIVKKNRNKP